MVNTSTSLTLLHDLQDLGNHARWAEFYDLYAPLILRFAERIGCRDEAMRQEVLQETMISMTRMLPRFRYDQGRTGFRGLLYTIVRNHVRSAWRRWKNIQLHADMPDWDIEAMPDESAVGNPEAVWEDLWRKNLFVRALDRVRTQVLPTTFESFRRHVIDGVPAKRVAAELQIEPNAVHQHRHRVIRLLREQVRLLKEDIEDGMNGRVDTI